MADRTQRKCFSSIVRYGNVQVAICYLTADLECRGQFELQLPMDGFAASIYLVRGGSWPLNSSDSNIEL